jgi:hypothetical protein
MRSAAFGIALLCSSLVSAPAFAMPFAPNPSSFASYLSRINWDDGKPRKFSGLRGCRKANFFGDTWYECEYGYVRIDDPVRGSIFCEIQKQDQYENYAVSWNSGDDRVTHGSPYPCRKL